MLFEMAKALRALSPADRAIAEARRAARSYVVAGYPNRAAGGAAGGGSRKGEPEGFVLPPSTNAIAIAGAIRRELLARGASANKLPAGTPTPFVASADGRAIVPRKVVLALGEGDIRCGERVLQRLFNAATRCATN
jgi:hypothetical protein